MKKHMHHQKRASWLSALIIMSLLLGFTGAFSGQVFAQQEEPPVVEPTEPAVPPQDPEQPLEQDPVETPDEPIIEEPTPEPVEDLPQAPAPLLKLELSSSQETQIQPADISIAAVVGLVKRLADINPYSSSSNPGYLCAYNDILYFGANGGDGKGRELWMYDGSNNPKLSKDIRYGSASSDPKFLTVFRLRLYFSADGGGDKGRELWSYEGSSLRLLDIRKGSASSDPQYLTTLHGKLLFSADRGSTKGGRELCEYDGSTLKCWDLNPGSASSNPTGLAVFDNKLYFSATDGVNFYQLWVYDGLHPPEPAPNSKKWSLANRPEHLRAYDGLLYFGAGDNANGRELWSYDGVNPAVLVKNIAPADFPSNPQYLRVLNDKLYFSADDWNDGSKNRELWYYDGTNAARAADVWPGIDSSEPEFLFPYKSKLVFSANGGDAKGVELWAFMPILTKTFRSIGDYDGWVRESKESSSKGGVINRTAGELIVGDAVNDSQYRSILHFSTSTLPDNAVLRSANLKVQSKSIQGTNPFATHGNLLVDIKKGAFSDSRTLQAADFQAAASVSSAAKITSAPVPGWHSVNLTSSIFGYIDKSGTTQFRLRFNKDDNDDLDADFIRFFSGNTAVVADRPSLIIKYYIP